MRRRTRIILVNMAVGLALAVLAPATLADNDGRGFYGATNDKVVTYAGFSLIAFFTLFVFCMSMLQRHLERRKAARQEAARALGDAHWQGGW